MATSDLTAERLRDIFDYDPDTGLFRRKVACARVAAGVLCGTKCSSGHLQIRIDRRRYLAHRLAWLYVYGKWPADFIDHINGIRTDNRISNLRDVTPAINSQNQRRATTKNRRSSLIGAHWHKESGKFLAHIRLNNVAYHIGSFETAQEAHEAYLEAKRRMHPGCTI